MGLHQASRQTGRREGAIDARPARPARRHHSDCRAILLMGIGRNRGVGHPIRLGGLALTLACVGTVPARAELVSGFLESEIPWEVDRGGNVGVLDRQRPELASRGIHLGGFKLNPSLSIATGYNSNVYGQTGTKTGDFYANIVPSANLTSNWSRHLVSL